MSTVRHSKLLLPLLLFPAILGADVPSGTSLERRLDEAKYEKKKCVAPGCDNYASPGRSCCSVECFKKLKKK